MVRIAMLHPDLGIGGAERLLVDAAVALQNKNHKVHIFTSHHDRSHCFQETVDGTLPVTVIGDWLPRTIFGRFYALCTYVRMLYVAFYVLFSQFPADVAICDLVSVCIPVLRIRIKTVAFYCHYPDLLLSQPGGVLKQLYRAPLDWLEEKTTKCADLVYVNSKFTKGVFQRTFKTIQTEPIIINPSINTENIERLDLEIRAKANEFDSTNVTFVSINRFERKKNVRLALEAMSLLRNDIAEDRWASVRLVVAGGYDNQLEENVSYYAELEEFADQLGIRDNTMFVKSPDDVEKLTLLSVCRALIYTPSNEHFGIVPLEAMFFAKPVIACNSGGPTETIVNGETGFLCEPEAQDFSKAMLVCYNDEERCKRLGQNAKRRFEDRFSFEAFENKLNGSLYHALMDQ